jgi:hypothetical protein
MADRTIILEGAMTPAVVHASQQSSIPDSLVPEVLCLHEHHFSSRVIAAWLETRTQGPTSHASVGRLIRHEAYIVASHCMGSKLAGALERLQSDLFDDLECLRLLQEDLRHVGEIVIAEENDPRRRSVAKHQEMSLLRQFRLLQFKLRLAGMGTANAGKPRPMPTHYFAEPEQVRRTLSPEAAEALFGEADRVADQLIRGRKPTPPMRAVAPLRTDLHLDDLPTEPAAVPEPESPLVRGLTGDLNPSTPVEPPAPTDIVLSTALIADFARWRLARSRGEKAEFSLTPENVTKVRQVLAVWKEIMPPEPAPPLPRENAAASDPPVANDDAQQLTG